MNFSDILSILVNEKTVSGKNGVYIGLKLDEQSKSDLNTLVQQLDLSNKVAADDFHTTVAYSKKYFKSDLENIKSTDINFTATVTGYDLFNNSKNRTACLVLTLDCPEAVSYHNKTIQQGAIYDFAEYKPHITIISQCTIGTKIDIVPFLDLKLKFNSIYQEYLDVNWNE